MSHFVIALLFTVGASTWIYTKLQRSSGNNTKRSVTASAIIGVFMFIVAIVILGMLPS